MSTKVRKGPASPDKPAKNSSNLSVASSFSVAEPAPTASLASVLPVPSHEWPFTNDVKDVLIPNDFRGHKDYVTSIAVDVATDRICTSSRDCTAMVFDATTGIRISVLQHEDWVNGAVFFDPVGDGETGRTGAKQSQNHYQTMKSVYRTPTLEMNSSASAATLIITVCEDGNMTWWGPRYTVLSQLMPASFGAPLTKLYIKSGLLFALGIKDVFVVSATLRTVLRKLPMDADPLCVALSFDECSLYCGMFDGNVAVIDIPSSTPVRRLLVRKRTPVRAIALDMANSSLYCACDEGTVTVWSLALGQTLRILTPHTGRCIQDMRLVQIPFPLPAARAKDSSALSSGASSSGFYRDGSGATSEFVLVVVTAGRDGTIVFTHDVTASTADTSANRIPTNKMPPSLRHAFMLQNEEAATASPRSPTSNKNNINTPFTTFPSSPASSVRVVEDEEPSPVYITPYNACSNCLLPFIGSDDNGREGAVQEMVLLTGEVDGRVLKFQIFPAITKCF